MVYSILDLIVGGLILFFGIAGGLKGLIKEVFSLLSVGGGLAFSFYFYQKWYPYVFFLENQKAQKIFCFICLFIFGFCVITLIGFCLQKLIKKLNLGWIDKAFGFLFGSFKILCIIFAIFHFIYKFLPQLCVKLTQNSFFFKIYILFIEKVIKQWFI